MTELSRRDLLRAGGAGAAGLAAGAGGYALIDGRDGGGGGAPAREERPNVVVIVIDNLRADHVGAYGSRRVRTPGLDALARESLRFTHARPESFPTVAARRAILTGRRSFPFRDWRAHPDLPKGPSWSPIARNRPTFLDILGAAGYATGLVTDNPWLLSRSYDRFRRSVDFVQGVPGQVPARRGGRRRVSDAELARKVAPALRGTAVEARTRAFLAVNPRGRSEDQYPAARVFDRAARWVARTAPRGPFALMVDAFSPHEPFDPPPRYLGLYGDPEGDGPDPIQPFMPPIDRVEDAGLTDGLLQRVRDLYAAEVTFTDRWLGNFLDELERAGLAESTMVVLLSDHGILLGEHGYVGKTGSQSYREVIEVPFMIRHPARRGAGRTSGYFASTHDVAPTVLSALGIAPPGRMDGEDLSVLLERRSPPPRPHFTASYDDDVVVGDGRWLMLSDNQGFERRLYDTRRNPRETRDVAARRPRVTARLWEAVLEDAGGTLPRFGESSVVSG